MKNKTEDRKLLVAALTKFAIGILMLGALLFLFAWSFRYWNAWLYITVFAICIFLFGANLYSNDKEFLGKRLNSKEKEKEQDVYTYATGFTFLSVFGVAGLDFRFSWSYVYIVVVIVSTVIMILGYILFVVTSMQNRFASRIVEIQEEQKVIDTGVYSVIRHPMYTAALIMFFASPVALGSYYALIPMGFFFIGIIFRIRNEEKVLSKGLKGYTDYMNKVKYRIIPYIW